MYLRPPKKIIIREPITQAQKDSIETQARLGYVYFSEAELIEMYGDTYKDTTIKINWVNRDKWNVKDSLRIKDSTAVRYVAVPMASTDSLLPVISEFSGWKFEAKMKIGVDYTFPPVNKFKIVWVLQDEQFIDIRKWYQKPVPQMILSGVGGYTVGRIHQKLKE